MRTVTVIIPTYNRVAYLKQALDSVLGQTYPRSAIDILVIDNASTDGTAEMMAEYGARGVRYVRKPVNTGALSSYALGWSLARGDYFSALDSDDVFEPQKIERQVAYLDAHPSLAYVSCRHYTIDDIGVRLSKSGRMPEGNLLAQLLSGVPLWVSSVLFRREALDRVGFYDERVVLAADWDLLIRLAFEGYSAGSIHMPLCNIRVHGANSSSDMTKAEPSLRLISDALFADSRLPTPLVNQRNQSQANMLTWLSLGFYRAQNAQEGSRLLAEAWGLDPRWQATPSIAADLLVSMAQNERFLGRVDTMTYVLDHLPACAVPVRTHSSAMIAKLQLVEAFERLAVGRIDKGRKSLSAGLKTYPAFATDVQAFMTLLNTYAVQAPNGTAGEFAALVVATLGSDAPVLLSNKSRIIASAALTGAFDDYSSQAWQKVPRQIAHAARRDVKVLRNRGVAAIFVKSLMFAERFGQSRKRQKVDLPS